MSGEATAGAVVSGPLGIGKTRLLAEALDRAAASGFAIETVIATQSAVGIPFGAFLRLMPDLPGVEQGVSALGLLRLAARGLEQRAGGSPLVVAVDDAHLLDPSSAALAHHLAQSGAARLLVSVRAGERAPDAVRLLWKDGLLERIEVEALSRTEVHAVLEAALGAQADRALTERLWRLSAGNPLFLREIVVAAQAGGSLVEADGLWRWQGSFPVTARLTELVEARLGAVPEGVRAALEVVAVAEPIALEVIEQLVDREALNEAERLGLLSVEPAPRRSVAQLSHPLYAEFLRARMATLAAREIKRRLAAAFPSADGLSRAELLRLTGWRLEAGLRERPGELLDAARVAMSALDFDLAGRLAAAAVDAGGGFRARMAGIEAMIGSGSFAAAEAELARLRPTLAQERLELAAIRANNLFWSLGRAPEAERVLERALAAHGGDGGARLRAQRAGFVLFTGRADRATEEALALARTVADRPAQLQAAMIAGWGLFIGGRPAEAVELAERFLPAAERDSEAAPFAADWLRKVLCASHWIAGRLPEAAAVGEAAYEDATRRHADSARALHAFVLGWVAREQGRIRTAASWFRDGLGVFREVDMFSHLHACLAELARCEAMLGNVDEAEALLAEVEPARVGFRMACTAELGRAWIAAARGYPPGAARSAAAAAALVGERGQHTFEALALSDAARLGDASAAARLAALAERLDAPLLRMRARQAEALAAADPEALVRCSQELERVGAALLAAEAAADAARRFGDAGRSSSARTAAARARSLAARCEGASTPALAQLGAEPLTPREREVATLAAQGLANRAIAERLVISVRTVDNHLHRAYAKLGVGGRGELAATLGPTIATREPRQGS